MKGLKVLWYMKIIIYMIILLALIASTITLIVTATENKPLVLLLGFAVGANIARGIGMLTGKDYL